jgi:imidazolonepropionase-like amidohydrolase
MNLKTVLRAACASVLLLFVCLIEGSAQVIVIKAGKLVDPETGTTALNQVIIIEGKKIKSIGKGLATPNGATVVDLSKATVLPGLFDAHTHLCLTVNKERDNGNYFFTTLLDTTAYRAIQGVANAREMLDSGFTTVRDVGNAGNYADTDLRRAIQRGLVPGPTIINAGKIIAPYGGQFHLQPEKRNIADSEYSFADTKDELKKAIRENIHYGALVIKIVVDDQRYIYFTDEIRFIVEEAGRAGLKVAAHCWTEQGARNAAEAGVASIEHGFEMSDATLELAKKNNVALVGTEFPESILRDMGIREPAVEHGVWVDRLRRANRIGVTIVFGTDATNAVKGQTRGSQAITFIDSYVDAGVTPRITLQAMTINAARLLGVEKERGAIKPGMYADIIATPENPLENILTLKRVQFVMKDGVVIKKPM